MNKTGPIIVIEDDTDDSEILEAIFKELNLPNELKLFDSGEDALAFISQPSVNPFIILSDINMSLMTGFELRAYIRKEPDLDIKCIPFLFFTTGASRQFVEKAYSLSVQGIFQKPPQYEKWKVLIKEIVDYWSDCISPGGVQ
jgi:CheY-like chemotaxis protein